MEFKSYGIDGVVKEGTAFDLHLEELSIQGYTVLPPVVDGETLGVISERLEAVYSQQESEFGADGLASINELNLARCPLAYDDYFLKLATNDQVLKVVTALLGDYFLLHLQNGVINRPSKEHHQSSWHRDLPYQDYVISKPIAVSAFWCIDEFTTENGATFVLPFSHREDKLPGLSYVEKHGLQMKAPAGSVIIFNSMLYHRAGYNRSENTRRGINHVYTVPILKQQIDLPSALEGKHADDPFLHKLLGYGSQVKGSVSDFRQSRQERNK